MAVNSRFINKNSKSLGVFGIGRNETAHRNKDKREEKATTDIYKILANVTAKINNLKEEYGTDKYETLLPKLDKVIYGYPRKTTSTTTVATTEDLDFISTAQIEELLNDIKARAIQMIAEQNPSVTDMITNTVTEATFEADPILTHLDMTSPGYALTTFVCLNNVENIDKRTANESNHGTGDSKHNISARSVKENAYTIAQNVEEMLQKELKSIYKKVKQKVSKDFQKEVKTAKSSIMSHTTKIIEKVKKVGGPKHSRPTTQKITGSRPNRGNKNTKDMSTKEEETTVDDFAMLTLYEQILAKTHEDNVMKMLATNKKRKIDETIRLSKRNPETLTDLTLKKDIKRYDDGDNIPDIDYNNDVTLPKGNNEYPTTDSSSVTNESSKEVHTEATPIEDTSYEGLSDKLAYKDYVNGFKNYLKFQRDEAKQNFSALVKYQAHKHHNVDDIGKYILNKIPQIPKRKRRFFDDTDIIDDQDISTKSDDSWFKKHFYMFIDNGPPNKYHTSETVEFKDVTKANRVNYSDVIEKPDSQASRRDKNSNLLGNVNLDELSRDLEDRKRFTSNLPFFNDDNISATPEMRHIEENYLGFRVHAPNIISKFFGKRQKEPNNQEKDKENNKDSTLKYDDDNFLFNTDLTRLQRNAVKDKDVEQESNETHTTLLNKQSAKTDKTKSNNEKVGCVSMVTQPTAIVNLHKSNAKGGKVQRLLNKLHFHKRKKNHKKKNEKRHCTRVQRFNPLRKLKDMFMSKPNQRVMGKNEETDYDMMYAHIDTFKPVKYDKLPSVDELRYQVPNITGYNMATQSEIVKADNKWAVNDAKFSQISSNAETNVATKDYALPNPRQFHYTFEKQPDYTRKFKNKLNMNENVFAPDNVMNVNVKTLTKMKDIHTISPITVDDIRSDLDKLKMRMSPQSYLKDIRTSPKIKGKPQPQREGVDRLINEHDKDFDDEITINAKLTRLTKYPISKFKHNKTNINPVEDNSKLYEFAENESSLNVHGSFPFAVAESSPKFEQYKKINKYDVTMSPIVQRTMKLIEDIELKDSVNDNKKYPDYFNDLVRWNKDILHYDKVSNPTWQDILKNIQGADEYTTPNVGLIQKELSEIHEHLAQYNIGGMGDKELGMKEKDSIRNDVATDIGSYVTSNPKYVAKNIKLEAESNKMNNEQTFGDFDEDPNVKNDPKSYSNHKSHDIINVLNNLYTKNNNYGVKKGHAVCKNNQDASPPKNSSNTAEVMSTPLYEDELYFEDEAISWFPKKISKNSLKAPKSEHKETRPITKVNEMPKQFYNTPLPMKNENFEMFLKENQLDVESLTSPIKVMPVVTETWHSKMNSLTKILNTNKITNPNDVNKEKAKTTESVQATTKGYKDYINYIVYKSYPENQIEYLNELEQDLFDDNVNGNVRDKRFNVHDYDSYKDSALIGREKLRDFKNKLRDFKNPDATEPGNLYSDTGPNDDLELTIINFDNEDGKNDKNKLVTAPNSQVLIETNSTAKNDGTINDLSNTKAKGKEGETEKEIKKPSNPLKADERDGDISDALTTEKKDPDLQDQTMNLEELSDFKRKDLPKRVQVSSQSYKYDVVYNLPSRTIDREEMSDENNEIDVSTPFLSNVKKSGNITKKKTNSDQSHCWRTLDITDSQNFGFDHVKVFRMDGVTDPKSRVARSVKTTNKRSTLSQTIHFMTVKKSRSKRLFRLIPILKEKLKKLSRKKSSISSKKTKTKEMTTRPLNVNATAIKTTTVPSATNKPTKRNERDSGFKLNYDDIFDYRLVTIDEKGDVDVKAETESETTPANKKVTTSTDNIESTKNTKDNAFNKLKRDVNSGVHTAKDVAALEVIVDLMKNTLSYAEKSPVQMFLPNNLKSALQSKISKATKAKMEQTTNSIQVHIAIPYDASNKKRCLDPVKVRKVFTAKLATPVDLEYQIHSIEDNVATTASADYGLSPGTYLLVDDANKACYAFKPVEMPIQMKDVTAKAADETKADKKISKEFVAAVNNYLKQLYENISASNENENKVANRKVRDTRWDKIKKYFGHDRVCKCKCKANKPMCSTCAACDSVIRELIFEFENLAKYMSDHCTEIQTFFWMNPTGGKALRDTVRKVDKSLNDYYKRVKGKCKGCKCKTFATYIDKRGLEHKNVTKNYIGEPLLNDLKSLNDHFDFSAEFIPYNAILKEKGDELVNTVNNCIAEKSIVKRTDIKRKCYDKDVYTLDNISVNIICNPDTTSDSVSPVNTYDETVQTTVTESENILLDYDLDKRNCKKSKSSLGGKVKPLLHKLFTYYDTQTETNTFKREAKYDQIESPLIADTGGSFWRDYLNKGNEDQNNEYKTSDVEISVVETNSEETPATPTKLTFKDKLRNIRKGTEATETTNQFVTETSTDSFSYDLNELYKLITTIKDSEDITFTDPTIAHNNTRHRKKKIKTEKHKKIHKTCKAKIRKTTKMLKAQSNSTNTSSNNDKTTSKAVETDEVPKTESTFATYDIEGITPIDINGNEENKLKSTTKMNLFDKIKKATLGFLSNIEKRNSVQGTTLANDKLINPDTVTIKTSKDQTNIISGATTQINPTILIINEENTVHDTKQKSKYRSILLSLLNYESAKIDKERERLRDIEESDADQISHEDMDDAEKTMIGLNEQTKKTTHELDYDMVNSIQGMEPGLETTPPGLQERPGLLERVAHKFGVKVASDKVAAAPTPNLKSKHHHHHLKTVKPRSKRLTSEEAEPTKIMKLYSNDPKRRKESQKRSSSTNMENPKPRIIHKDDGHNNRILRKTKERWKNKYKKPEFDRYVREENGIYRLRRNNDSTDITDNKDLRKIAKISENGGFVGQRKKQKRSNSEIKNSESLSVWHSTGLFVATITSFYIVLVSFAAVINWVFGR